MDNTMQTLSSVQPSVMEFLQKCIIKNRMAHAYLFEGERGTAKTEVALLFAKSQLCPQKLSIKEIEKHQAPEQECVDCYVCKRVDQLNHPDLFYIVPEGLSIKKEQILSLQEEFRKKAVESERKVYILTEAEKLTNSSANSLLKYLEEPHEGTTIILLSSAISKMLPTILSRCQIISFKPLNIDNIANLLIEKGVPSTKAILIASIKRNLEDGLLLYQNEWFGTAQKIVEKIFMRLDNSATSILAIQEDWIPHFKERDQIDLGLELLLYMFRDILYLKIGKEESVVNKELIHLFVNVLPFVSESHIAQKMDVILKARKKLSANTNQQLLMEQLVIELQEGFVFV
ncbi:MAG: holB [Bacillales bacterium]|jgi:DNA polymerase-3 subunit delta'|nr:holB [Bacillales bacterium]